MKRVSWLAVCVAAAALLAAGCSKKEEAPVNTPPKPPVKDESVPRKLDDKTGVKSLVPADVQGEAAKVTEAVKEQVKETVKETVRETVENEPVTKTAETVKEEAVGKMKEANVPEPVVQKVEETSDEAIQKVKDLKSEQAQKFLSALEQEGAKPIVVQRTETKVGETAAPAVVAPEKITDAGKTATGLGSKLLTDMKNKTPLPKTALKPGLYATFETSKGDIVVELFEKQAPETVANFVGLASGTKEYTDPKTGEKTKSNFYDGQVFHRVIPKFMIQGGDPLGSGTGGPGYTFGDEFVETLKFDAPGYLAMANRGPSTNGSQFFITVAPTPHLNGKHTIFGKVVQGQDVATAISEVRRGANDKPVEPVIVKHVKIERMKE